MRNILSLFILVIFLFSACTKKENIFEQTHINEVIEDNEAPPYSGVTTVQIQNYVNKIFIDLIGREPVADELDNFTALLKSNNLSLESRNSVLSTLQATPAYYNRFWEIYSGQLLQGVTREYVQYQVFFYQEQYNLALSQGQTLFAQIIQDELNRLIDLLAALPDYASGQIDINEFIGRMIFNVVYDEINMGSENYVNACFENLFKRLPTLVELENAITMVDGFPGQMLFLDGTSKSDFVNIMTTVPEFYQGIAIDLYGQLLSRDPSSEEMGAATIEFTENENFKAVQRMVMQTDEYAGF